MGVFGCMGMFRYSILHSMLPAAVVGRANSALNALHLTAASAVQAAMGAVIAQWAPGQLGHNPVLAYRAAFAMPLAIQIAALAWFVLSAQLGREESLAGLRERSAEVQQFSF